jgi:AraC-like DNA-binding protein
MFYFLSKNKFQLQHISSGKLVASSDFIHPNRILDTFVILVGLRGNIYITQDDREFVLSANKFLILFPGHHHYGTRPSLEDEDVTYYWCHFKLTDNSFRLLTEDEISQRFFWEQHRRSSIVSPLSEYYLLPEFGTLYSSDRTMLIFNQLLDIAYRDTYSPQIANYALSLLAMEISQEFYTQYETSRLVSDKTHYNLMEIMQWISLHYEEDPSVKDIAVLFNYNADYLSSAFKRYTGMSLVRYINKTKIAAAKKLLLSTKNSIKEIALQCGFHDDKHFMKVFKQLEEVTPSQYRSAFAFRHTNKE